MVVSTVRACSQSSRALRNTELNRVVCGVLSTERSNDVLPMMTYGCESWVLREKEKTRLQATKMSVLGKIAGLTRLDCIRNEETRHRLQQRSI